jgi:cyclase
MRATIAGRADIPGTTLDHVSSAAPPPGVSIADAVLQQVADGVYAYIQPDGSWWINNTGFLAGPQGVISIDTCSTERRTRAYRQAIATVTAAPVRAVVNTHHHGDHTFGNCMFPGAAIIAQERARAEAIAFGPPRELPFWDGPDWGNLTLDPPFVTFKDEITIYAGELRAEVRHVGTPAHTTNDSIVWMPGRSVLFAGDLIFNGGTPFLLMGSVAGAIEALERVVRPLGALITVPGHGAVFTGSAPIDATLDYLRFVLDAAGRAAAAGLPPLAAARETDLGRFAGWTDPERIVGNLHRACAELRGTPRGAPIDVAAALADMVAYNGGRPLTCYA